MAWHVTLTSVVRDHAPCITAGFRARVSRVSWRGFAALRRDSSRACASRVASRWFAPSAKSSSHVRVRVSRTSACARSVSDGSGRRPCSIKGRRLVRGWPARLVLDVQDIQRGGLMRWGASATARLGVKRRFVQFKRVMACNEAALDVATLWCRSSVDPGVRPVPRGQRGRSSRPPHPLGVAVRA